MFIGAIIVKSNTTSPGSEIEEHSLTYVDTEEQLLEKLIDVVTKYDPEILIGWDIETLSWGYVFHRASVLGKPLNGRISRIPTSKFSWSANKESVDLLESLRDIKLPGRIVLDIWRIMKYEIGYTKLCRTFFGLEGFKFH